MIRSAINANFAACFAATNALRRAATTIALITIIVTAQSTYASSQNTGTTSMGLKSTGVNSGINSCESLFARSSTAANARSKMASTSESSKHESLIKGAILEGPFGTLLNRNELFQEEIEISGFKPQSQRTEFPELYLTSVTVVRPVRLKLLLPPETEAFVDTSDYQSSDFERLKRIVIDAETDRVSRTQPFIPESVRFGFFHVQMLSPRDRELIFSSRVTIRKQTRGQVRVQVRGQDDRTGTLFLVFIQSYRGDTNTNGAWRIADARFHLRIDNTYQDVENAHVVH